MDASKTYVDEFFGGCDKISLLELAKIQAKVLVPVIRALRKECVLVFESGLSGDLTAIFGDGTHRTLAAAVGRRSFPWRIRSGDTRRRAVVLRAGAPSRSRGASRTASGKVKRHEVSRLGNREDTSNALPALSERPSKR